MSDNDFLAAGASRNPAWRHRGVASVKLTGERPDDPHPMRRYLGHHAVTAGRQLNIKTYRIKIVRRPSRQPSMRLVISYKNVAGTLFVICVKIDPP